MEVYVVYKSYSGFEDNDSNGADIIGVYSSLDKAKKALSEAVKEDEEFFKENETKYVLTENGILYFLSSDIGDIEFSITRREVE